MELADEDRRIDVTRYVGGPQRRRHNQCRDRHPHSHRISVTADASDSSKTVVVDNLVLFQAEGVTVGLTTQRGNNPDPEPGRQLAPIAVANLRELRRA